MEITAPSFAELNSIGHCNLGHWNFIGHWEIVIWNFPCYSRHCLPEQKLLKKIKSLGFWQTLQVGGYMQYSPLTDKAINNKYSKNLADFILTVKTFLKAKIIDLFFIFSYAVLIKTSDRVRHNRFSEGGLLTSYY